MTQSGDWRNKGFVAHYNALYGLSEAEVRPYLDRLALTPEDSLADFGCGDGSFLALAAPLVGSAVGVDGSPHQVELARRRLAGLKNVEVVASGFLEFDAAGRRFTKAFSRKALHHLTDPEKEAFLRRVGPSFAPGGLFLIEDVMFSFGLDELEARMPQLLKEGEAYLGSLWEAKRADFLHTLREEFPASQEFWAAAFAKAGFAAARRWSRNCFLGGILARKES